MSKLIKHKHLWFVPLVIGLVLVITWQIALAQAPTPNPLPNVTGVDITANGPAATIHGDPLSGRKIFAANCTTCHGDLGAMGEDNPGSDDGIVPVVNPLDPEEFLDESQGDPAAVAGAIDLFIQHGSRPAGDDPQMLMPAWGDKKLLTQAQIADVEAYVMQLNGVYWPDKWYPPAEVQMTATRNSSTVTYSITIVNHGGSALDSVLLRDTLPPGLAYINSEFFGNNLAKVDGSTVEWSVGGVPRGESLGPFTIVTGLTGTDVPPNVAQVVFNFCTFSGTCLPASQVSDPVVPGK
jgi:uncharacterized repeat protein (TIGR01451 family)